MSEYPSTRGTGGHSFSSNQPSHTDLVGFGGQYSYYKEPYGHYLLGHRYYDSFTGRFVTRDPIGYKGGINLYGFAGNNPVNESDPSGLATVKLYYIPAFLNGVHPLYHTGIQITDDKTGKKWAIAFFPVDRYNDLAIFILRVNGTYKMAGAIYSGATFPNEKPAPIMQTVINHDKHSGMYYVNLARKRLTQINNAPFAYEAGTQNSNTAAHDLMMHMKIKPPNPPYDTPAYSNTLTDKWTPYQPFSTGPGGREP